MTQHKHGGDNFTLHCRAWVTLKEHKGNPFQLAFHDQSSKIGPATQPGCPRFVPSLPPSTSTPPPPTPLPQQTAPTTDDYHESGTASGSFEVQLSVRGFSSRVENFEAKMMYRCGSAHSRTPPGQTDTDHGAGGRRGVVRRWAGRGSWLDGKRRKCWLCLLPQYQGYERTVLFEYCSHMFFLSTFVSGSVFTSFFVPTCWFALVMVRHLKLVGKASCFG